MARLNFNSMVGWCGSPYWKLILIIETLWSSLYIFPKTIHSLYLAVLKSHHTGRHQVAVSSERKIFSTHCCLPWWTKKSHQFDLKASKLQIHFCIRRLNKRRTCKFQQILISDWSAPVLEQNIYEAPCGS